MLGTEKFVMKKKNRKNCDQITEDFLTEIACAATGLFVSNQRIRLSAAQARQKLLC